MIDIEAQVIEYKPDAMQDDFASGAFASYDATVFEVLSPRRIKGQNIAVFHQEPAPENSFWRKVGAKLHFSVEESDLASNITLFTRGLWNIREIS